ncbi:Zn-dependent hydrolase [Saccharolobus solfataricus]|uniref:N-carbamoyl-L-amino acid amidohydrolase (AmaB) n=3 Tax=Saccharolobus solfataricus TaxID=2287 RepID=Q97VB6_SACS2|nr:Zn-dependent hydrolase [Saccharolobus solfataricus]AAK42829.1 N-carbamoyl-L-amino acid amidohydrolase (amaB) [Saccharolobus solfataricus P2]AKA72924.1 Zn-dependent hydrolase [Saccharolobus solfataricus]AKA75623.1 Zn-dependent hydrolase [Saccharolobus solfataricus]AKA78316.1 Zn-dependent hydrolase [Saccharolobus solfataricus]AZF67435.1 Zn-dependent hydrolase [Saccharolobus solfataricus]
MNPERFLTTFHSLTNIGWTEDGVLRLALNEYDIKVREELIKILSSIGVHIMVDDAGNIIGELGGKLSDAIAIGSHMDSVPYGGKYDGFYGVMAGLEVLRSIKERGISNHSIKLIDFTNEEGSRFQPSLLGSGLTTGIFDKNYVYSRRDKDNISFEEALRVSGFMGDESNRLMHMKPNYYLELHIEQGPILEEEGYQIGIPLGIAGLSVYEFTFKGQSSQTGPTPMDRRRDALVGASKFVVSVRDHAKKQENLRATVGILNVKPNVYNAIPREVRLTVDVRSIERNRIDHTINEFVNIAKSIADDEKLEVEYRHLWTANPVSFSDEVISVIERACKELSMRYKFMYSWAGHDAQYMTKISKVGMIFIPSHLGISHAKEEYSSDEDMLNGLRVLEKAVELLNS